MSGWALCSTNAELSLEGCPVRGAGFGVKHCLWGPLFKLKNQIPISCNGVTILNIYLRIHVSHFRNYIKVTPIKYTGEHGSRIRIGLPSQNPRFPYYKLHDKVAVDLVGRWFFLGV